MSTKLLSSTKIARVALALPLACSALKAAALLWDGVRRMVPVVAAPVIGLAFVVLMPLVGLGAFAWISVAALRERAAATPTADLQAVRPA